MDELDALYFDARTHPRGEQAKAGVEGSLLIVKRFDGKRVEFPLDSTDIKWGGADGESIVFTDRNQPPAMVFVDDASILDRIEQSAPGEIAAKIRAVRSAGRRTRYAWTGVLVGFGVAVVLLIAGALAGFPWLVDLGVGLVPPSWEESAGDVLAKQMVAGKVEVKDAAVLADVKVITDRLVGAAGKVPYGFDFHVLKDSTVNAFAVPGGEVVLLTGLLEKAESPEEVAGVVAHEIQHVLRRHSLRRLARQLGLVVVLGLLFGDASGLAQGASVLLDSRFSREEESEADREGAKLLLAAGIPVDGMATFFDRMAKDSGKLENAFEFVSSHPASEGRAAAIRKVAADHAAKAAPLKPLAIDWKALQARLAKSTP